MNARQRFRNGQTTFTTPSRFIKEIDKQFVLNTESAATSRPAHITPSASSLSSMSRLTPTTGAKEKSKKKAIRSEWAKDDCVMHRVFGKGTVLEVYRENDNEKIDILFDAVGKKTLLLTYAKLEKVES
jgi:DNA helicase-2/ATP-dependent DNA helicase PcrA